MLAVGSRASQWASLLPVSQPVDCKGCLLFQGQVDNAGNCRLSACGSHGGGRLPEGQVLCGGLDMHHFLQHNNCPTKLAIGLAQLASRCITRGSESNFPEVTCQLSDRVGMCTQAPRGGHLLKAVSLCIAVSSVRCVPGLRMNK